MIGGGESVMVCGGIQFKYVLISVTINNVTI